MGYKGIVYEKSQDLTPSILQAKSESLHQWASFFVTPRTFAL